MVGKWILRSELKSFAQRNPIGLVMRTFSSKPEGVAYRVQLVREAVDRAREIGVFSRIDVYVWEGKGYVQESDCGKTAAELRKHFPKDDFKQHKVQIHVFANGDPYVDLMNFAAANAVARRCKWVMYLSPDARSYLSAENMATMLAAASTKGVKVAGLAISELTDSILKGRIANTFAMWDLKALSTAGNFNFKAAMPRVSEVRPPVQSYCVERGEFVDYPRAGVEEMYPLVHLTRLFGSCIAPVLPTVDGRYQIPTDADERERHHNKIANKRARQNMHLADISKLPDYLLGGIHPDFRSN